MDVREWFLVNVRLGQGCVMPLWLFNVVCSARFAVWCPAAGSHLSYWIVLSVVPVFLTGGVLECNIAHRRTVAVLCMLYKFRFNLMRSLYGALYLSVYVPVLASYKRGFGRTLVYLCASSLQNLAVPHDFYSPLCICVVGSMFFYWPTLLAPYFVFYCSPILFFLSMS